MILYFTLLIRYLHKVSVLDQYHRYQPEFFFLIGLERKSVALIITSFSLIAWTVQVGLKCIKTRSAATSLSNCKVAINLPIVRHCTRNITLWHAPPPPPSNQTMTWRLQGEQPQGGEWQNISWLPFHLNTSIKAHCGWVSGVAPLHDSNSPDFMQREKLNVYPSGDKLNPGPDTLAVKKYSVSGALHYKSLFPPLIPQHRSYSSGLRT